MTTLLQRLLSIVKSSSSTKSYHKDGESNISIDLCSTHSPKNNATKNNANHTRAEITHVDDQDEDHEFEASADNGFPTLKSIAAPLQVDLLDSTPDLDDIDEIYENDDFHLSWVLLNQPKWTVVGS